MPVRNPLHPDLPFQAVQGKRNPLNLPMLLTSIGAGPSSQHSRPGGCSLLLGELTWRSSTERQGLFWTLTYIKSVPISEVVLCIPAPLVQGNVLRSEALQQLQDLLYDVIYLCKHLYCVWRNSFR